MGRWNWVLFVFPALAGCSASGRDIAGGDAGAGGGAASPSPSGTGSSSSVAANDGGVASTPKVDEVYGNSGTDLYRLNPNTKAVSLVGSFEGCQSGVIDIALDQDSNLFGTTTKALYRIDRNSAVCTKIASGDYPNSLSFVPKGTVDSSDEALVGYNDDVYVRIDTQSGKVTTLGTLGQGYKSSGDIVSVIGGGTYLTVKGKGCADCIVEVDPATGAMKRKLGTLDHQDVYGLAFWAGSAYGFDLSGQLFEVDLSGGTVQTKPIGIPKAPADLSFWGAGSTTAAPVTAVK